MTIYYYTVPTPSQHKYEPIYECHMHEDKFVLSVDLPSVAKEDINLELVNNTLYLTGERKSVTSGDVIKSTRTYGTFSLEFHLELEEFKDEIDAVLADGVLTVTIFKKKSQVKKIEVK